MSIALVLLAAEKAAPLIDIDGTVFLQFAIFLILIALLYVLVFRPYLRVRDDREKGIGGARAEAKGMEEQASAIAVDYEARLTKAKMRGADERTKLRAEGKAHEREVLKKASDAAHAQITSVRASAKAEQDQARHALSKDTPIVGKALAAKILGRAL